MGTKATRNTRKPHGLTWSSRFTFLMASIGFAVGLGNIWKFPYIAGENGGGAFVFVYIICIVVIGLPILMAELMIGRVGGGTPDHAVKKSALISNATPRWRWLGVMTMITSFLILIVYSVVAGWVFEYLYQAMTTGFTGISKQTSIANFAQTLASPIPMVFWTSIGIILTGIIVSAGIKNGIERAVSFLMPALFVLLLVMVGYAMIAGDFSRGFSFLFQPDFSKINASIILIAIGQAFFSVGVAMAAMMTYGAYLSDDIPIGRTALIIIVADTMVAILAGLAIFPLVFQHGMNPQGGPGLIFEALPLAFAHMPAGHLFATLFFMLLSFAAITSMVGLLEPLVAWVEEHTGMSRRKGCVIICLVIICFSLLSILSYNHISKTYPLSFLPGFADKNLNATIGFITDQITLPIGGLLIAIFAGWVIEKNIVRKQFEQTEDAAFRIWRFLIRYIAPLSIALMLILGLTAY